jgi:DNA-directed RNA polymerase specialized sigma24 family protein
MKEPEARDPMAEATAIRDAPEREHLETDEVGAAFDGLSPDDKLKVGAIEADQLGGTGFCKGDLVHEAVCRALTGRRKCPRDVAFMAFLVETMKSIASHAREKHRRVVIAADPPETANAALSGAADPVSAPSPEDDLVARQEAAAVQKIYGHFEDDDEAALVLMGWADGLRGKALREATGLDQTGLDYAIKRIRSRMRKLYPNGWMP